MKKTEENIRWMDEKKNINSSLSAESHHYPGMEIKVSFASNLKLDEKIRKKKSFLGVFFLLLLKHSISI